MAEKKFYVVWKGKEPGVYDSWKKCERQINGFNGAKYKSFSSREQAEEAFLGPHEEYIGKTVLKPIIPQEILDREGSPISDSFCVDAACSGNPGDLEYRGVDTDSGAELFRVGPLKQGTVNIGEFLAIVHGLAFLKERNMDWPIYSDSKTAIKWVRDKKANTKLQKSTINAKVFELIERAERWLKTNSYPNEILKWKTKYWGEIPADFGRK